MCVVIFLIASPAKGLEGCVGNAEGFSVSTVTFLGSSAELRKVAIGFVVCVCPSVRPPARPPARPSARPRGTAGLSVDSLWWIVTLEIFTEIWRPNSFLLKMGQNKGHFT
jgi:hypothetical protein